MPNGTYGGVRGRKTKVGRKLLRFPPTRFTFIVAKHNQLRLSSKEFRSCLYKLLYAWNERNAEKQQIC